MASKMAQALKAWREDPAVVAVLALGVTQICAWGTTLYALGILGQPISRETGWPLATVFGGLTAGLLVSGAVSAWFGRLIDAHGGQRMMMLGSLIAAFGLAAVSVAPNQAVYIAAWLVLGVAMRLTLYDAAFAALVQVTPSRGRRAISYLTLFGGFASSMFWPIGHWLNAGFGWRTTMLIFAGVNLFVCLPLHWIGLARREATPLDAAAQLGTPETPEATIRATHLTGAARGTAMVLFGLVLASCAFVYGALASHLVAVIAASGVGLATAVWLAALKGAAQVAGRAADIVWGQNLHPVTLGRISLAVLPVALLVLVGGGASFTTALFFTILLGISNGLLTIVRGAVPLALFGTQGYGAVLGKLATPYLITNAIAPMAFAMIVERAGMATAIWVLLIVGAIAAACMEVMAAWYRRQ